MRKQNVRMRFTIFDDMSQCTQEAVASMLPLVSVQRREEALAFKHVFGQFACLKSYLMLQELLQASGYDLGELVFARQEHGKPILVGHENLHFNISHCKTGILVALAEAPVGVDIESYRRLNDALVAHTMNEGEQALIRQAADPTHAFTALWTQKEAVVKWRGTGLTEDLHTLLDSVDMAIETHECTEYAYSIVCSA